MIRTLVLIPALALMAGCVNVLERPEAPDAYYRIGAIPGLHELNASVSVHEPEASRLFSGRTIAAEDDTGALRVVRGVQWTDNATEMMQNALLDALSGKGEYAALPSSSAGPSQFELNWRLTDFTLFGNTARCNIDAVLVDGRTRRVRSQAAVATSAVALDATNAARAKALTDAGRACISELAAFIAAETALPD